MISPEIDLAFADGEYHFALNLPQLVELEEKCGFIDAAGNRKKRGIVAIYADVRAGLAVQDGQIVAIPAAGHASAFDCREVIRLGLIGGGYGTVNAARVVVDGPKALQLVAAYVDTQPIVKRWTVAAAILRAAVEGYEPPKKDEPALEPAKSRTRKRRSTSEK
jgi:hypothetical protein